MKLLVKQSCQFGKVTLHCKLKKPTVHENVPDHVANDKYFLKMVKCGHIEILDAPVVKVDESDFIPETMTEDEKLAALEAVKAETMAKDKAAAQEKLAALEAKDNLSNKEKKEVEKLQKFLGE